MIENFKNCLRVYDFCALYRNYKLEKKFYSGLHKSRWILDLFKFFDQF